MATCNFCQRKFQSSQGVRAHLRRCERYQTSRKTGFGALGTMPRQALPKAASTPAATPPLQSNPLVAQPDPTTPWRELLKSMAELSTKRDAPQTPQQQRRKILQAAKVQVIDHDRTSLGQVTPAMRGAAKAAIEREMAILPLEELPFDEVCERAIAIRERCYAPTFTRHAQEAERQNAEREARHRKQIEDMAAGHRADRRKTTLIEQAIGQARARCEAKGIIGQHRFSVLVDIELRLTEWLTGRESVPEAHAIIQTVLDARFVEAEAKQDAARAKKDAKWRREMIWLLVLGALVGLVVLALKFPAHTSAVFRWIQQTFGLTPEAEAGSPNREASKTTPPAASAESRPGSTRRRKDPVAPPSPESPWAPSVGPAQGRA